MKDLCARLPYGVKVRVLIHKNDPSSEETLVLNGYEGHLPYKLWTHNSEKLSKYGCSGKGFYVSEVKPYLRPMSSMTREEREFMEELSEFKCTPDKALMKIDFYLKHHIDFRGLIPMGLALEATEGMYQF